VTCTLDQGTNKYLKNRSTKLAGSDQILDYWSNNVQTTSSHDGLASDLQLTLTELGPIRFHYAHVDGPYRSRYAIAGSHLRLAVVDSGTFNVKINDVDHVARFGDALVALPGDIVENRCEGETGIFLIHCPLDRPVFSRLRSILWQTRSGKASKVDKRMGTGLLNLSRCLSTEIDRWPPSAALPPYIASLADTIFSAIEHETATLHSVDRSEPGERARDTFSRAYRFVEDHIHQSFDVPDVARAIGCSRSVLEAAFTQCSSVTINRYIRLRHLEYARELLVTAVPDESVARAATKAQYTNTGRFATHYAEEYGELPSETLARARGYAAGKQPERRN